MSNRTSAFIRRAEKFLENSGIVMNFQSVDRVDEDEVNIVWFERVNAPMGQGGKALKIICDYADEMSIVLSLVSPVPLISTYENFGFVQDGPASSKNVSMYRYFNV